MTSAILAGAMLVTSLPVGVVQAGMVSTEQLIEAKPQSDPAPMTDARERLGSLIDRDDVRAELVRLGVTPDEATARLQAMSDAELSHIAGRLDALPAGEGIGGAVLIVFLVFGIFVLLDATGFFNVFNFVCGPGECTRAQNVAVQPQALEPAAGIPQAEPYGYEQPLPPPVVTYDDGQAPATEPFAYSRPPVARRYQGGPREPIYERDPYYAQEPYQDPYYEQPAIEDPAYSRRAPVDRNYLRERQGDRQLR